MRHCDIWAKRLKGTGTWSLELDDFRIWRDGNRAEHRLFGCCAIPGAGITVTR
jgi:hypothetical protein